MFPRHGDLNSGEAQTQIRYVKQISEITSVGRTDRQTDLSAGCMGLRTELSLR